MKKQGPPWRAFFLRWARLLFLLGLLGLLSPWPARWLGDSRLAWPLDLAAHWQLLWLPIAWLGLFGIPLRWPLRCLLAALLALPPWLSSPPRVAAGEAGAESGGAALRLALANLYLDNRDPQALRDWLSREPVDVLALVELGSDYAAALKQLPGLPHRELLPRADAFGLGLLSRWPLRELRTELDGGGIPRLRAIVEHPEGDFELVVLHPMPPLAPRWQRLRNAGFASLHPGQADALAVGDFNATPWSTGAAELAGAGWRWVPAWRPSWPAAGGGFFGIPIDAVWAQGSWCWRSAEQGPPLGGDHLPLRVSLSRGCR